VDLRRIVKFAGVSGAGLCLDYAIVSASCGVTFVFVVSARRIFAASDDHFLLGLFAIYALYQVLAVSAASWLVGEATHLLDGRYLLGKTLILPLSFTANYLFMSWLFGARARGVDVPACGEA
jgi:putative flippase GtrA